MNSLFPRTAAAALCLIIVGILLGALSEPARAQVFPPGSVAEATLNNGLRVVVRTIPGAPLVSASVWIRAGSRNETTANNGTAHLLEHYLFESKPGAESFDYQVDGAGGIVDADTTRDHTHYYVDIPLAGLDVGLKVLAQMLTSPTFDAARLETERKRAASEVQQRDSSPLDSARATLFALAYKVSPYRMPIGGTTDGIALLTIKQLKDFYSAYYHPENATLVLVGDISPGDASKVAARYFGDWKRGSAIVPAVVQEPERTTSPPPRVIPLRLGAGVALLAVAYPAPSVQNARDAVATDVLYSLLANGRHSILAEKMARDGLIANYAADFLTTRDPGLFLIWGSAPPDRVMAARSRIAQILGLVAAGKFSDADLARAKQSLVGSYTLENETVEDQGTSLGFYDAIASYKYAVNYEAMVQATTRDDLERVVKHYFRAVYTVVMAPPGTVVGD